MCGLGGGERGNSLRFSVDLRWERRGLPLARHIPPPGMLLDMPRSLCALDHAGTGKEENSAKKKRSRESACAGAEEW